MNKKPIYEELEQRLKELEKEALTRKQAEEATLESEEELKAIFDSVRDGIALLDMTGKVIKANKRIVEVGGYSEEEIVGRRIKLLKMFAPSSIAKMLPAFAKIISGQKVLPIEVETYTKNGEKLVIEIHGSLFKKRGKAMGIVAVMRDITERKQVEEALKESENRFRTLVEKSVEAIFLVNFDMEIVFWNRAAEEMIGLRTTPTKKITLSDVLTPDSLNIAMANVARASKNGTTRPRPYELTIRKPDGTLADLEVFIGLVEYDGKPHMLGTARDITERKQVEEALRESEVKYHNLYDMMRLITDNVPDLIWAKDMDDQC
jgi:PAS domain S-box-containing protein